MKRAFRYIIKWAFRLVLLFLLLIALMRFVPPPITPYQISEWWQLGESERDWVELETLPPHLMAAIVAAEDARFCQHHGFDLEAIKTVLDSGASGGASSITQQTVKNVLLWQGRSWLRKGLEAALTPYVELVWGKRRILELYINVAEFDAGTFGVEAGAQGYFGKSSAKLSAWEAAQLASVLPNPKGRSAARPNANQTRRIPIIADGAATIIGDGRADCFLRSKADQS